MPKRSRLRIPPFRLGGITDRTHDFEHVRDVETRRRKTYKIIDRAPFQKWVIFVTGAGFLTDAYDIFAVNTVLPMVKIVYWDNDPQTPTHQGAPPKIDVSTYTALVCATLAGSILGQILFGILGDLFGRKRMYGLLLLIILWATLGLASSAAGSNGSMEITGWFFVWRFIMGIGVGGDYPLSAAITSEFAPKRHRPAMLATLFFMQPVGQFIGTIVAMVVTYLYQSQMEIGSASACPPAQLPCYAHCSSPECFRAVDRAWRWIIGFGGIPALVAFIIRLQIPESPRYTMDVLLDTQRALDETTEYFEPPGAVIPQYEQDVNQKGRMAPNDILDIGSHATSSPPLEQGVNQKGGLAPKDPGIGSNATSSSPLVDVHGRDTSKGSTSSSGMEPNNNDTSITAGAQLAHRKTARTFPTSNELKRTSTFLNRDNHHRRDALRQWRLGFNKYFFIEGNWIHLAGTMMCWFLLDISFYGLGMSSPNIIQELWNVPNPGDTGQVWDQLWGNAWHSSIIVSLGALIGGALMIYVVHRHRPVKAQSLFFAVLGCFLFIVGGTFNHFLLKDPPGHWALVIFYFCCQLFFNLGANATTFIIPSEQFPTQYRCTCIGLSAASGKLGSVIVQVALGLTHVTDAISQNDSDSQRLYIPLLVFGFLMLLGTFVTQIWVPDSRDAHGNSMSLEDLAKGRAYMKTLRKTGQWWNRWHTADVDHTADTEMDDAG